MSGRKNKNLLVTLTIGDQFERLSVATHPLMRRYANNIEADFKVINEASMGEVPPGMEKLQLIKYFDDYERILFIDTDILITPGSPNLFNVVPPSSVGAYIVLSDSQPLPPAAQAIQKDITTILRAFGGRAWQGPYFNSGVMVFDRSHRRSLEEASRLASRWTLEPDRVFMDQTLLNYCILQSGHKIFDIGYRFNHTPAFRSSRARFNSHFIHYAGRRGHRRGERLRQIRVDAWVLRNRWVFELAKASPWLVGVSDRL